jgi:hypothetical protein
MRPWLVSFLAVLACLTAVGPAQSQEQTYSYSVAHPLYGTIGTYTQTIARSGDTTRVDGQLRVAAKVLGITVHREESDHIEIFRGDRLVSLLSVTTTNGVRLDVRGEAQGNHFVVRSLTGNVEAPADIAPSDPWVLRQLGVGTVVSMKTGHIIPTRVTGGEPTMVSLQGAAVATRHFMVHGEREQETWMNDHDVPIKFRSVENGTAIDFILTSPLRDAMIAEAHLVPAAKVRPDEKK